MASSTPKYGLPYPALTDVPDVPYYLQQIAQQAEAVLQTLVRSQDSDATYPKSLAGITAETVVDRITIAAVAYPRRINVVSNCYVVAVTNPATPDYIIYASVNGAAATQIGYTRKTLAAASAADFMTVTGKVDVPANQTCVIETRITRFAGTGTITTSANTKLTNTNVLMVRT
jgi:hypothetical protein